MTFLIVRVMKHWSRMLREAVDASSLEACKTRLDEALSCLIQWKLSLPRAVRLELDDL